MSHTSSVAPQGYSPAQIALHWAVVLLVAFMFFTGDNMTDAFDEVRKSGACAWNYPWISIHFVGGVSGLPSFFATRKSLNFGFLRRLDVDSSGWGSDASAAGAI